MRSAYRRRLAEGFQVWRAVLEEVLNAKMPRNGRPRLSSGEASQLSEESTPSARRMCMLLFDLAQNECGEDWDVVSHSLHEAVGSAAAVLTPAQLRSPRKPPRWPDSVCLAGEWCWRALKELYIRSRFCDVPACIREQVASRRRSRIHARTRSTLFVVARRFQDVLRLANAGGQLELFLGSRWPVWSLLQRLQAYQAMWRPLARGGCQIARWRSLLKKISSLAFPPALADLEGRRRWHSAFDEASRLLHGGKGLVRDDFNASWQSGVVFNHDGTDEGDGISNYGFRPGFHRRECEPSACREGLLSAVLLLCLHFASRDCLQPQQTTDDFARHRAFFEHLLQRAFALVFAIGITVLARSPWPVFSLLALLGRLHTGHATTLDCGPRQWIVTGEKAVVGEQFLMLTGLVHPG